MRITHLPTGVVVSCQNEKSQLQNKESAMRVLRARLHQLAREEADAEASAARRSQVRTVDRSERIRTYNFPENRISDHRTGYKSYNLDAVLDGDLDAVVQSCVDADEQARMAASASGERAARAVRRRPPGDDAARRGRRGQRPRRRPAARRPPAAREPAEVRRLMVLRGTPAPAGYDDLVGERAARVPLQHLTGRAGFRRLELAVGPGVFVPRPETELVVEQASVALASRPADAAPPVVVDLATGSGAIALAVKDEAPAAAVHAVEVSDLAHGWAAANRDRLGLDVEVRLGDARRRSPTCDGTVDVVTCQPAVHPGRAGAGRPGGARPRPGGRALRRQRRRAGRPARRRAPRCCCGPAGCSSWSTPTARVSRCRGPCGVAGSGAPSATSATSPAGPG